MNKLAKVKYLKQIIEELEKELEAEHVKEVNTEKDAGFADPRNNSIDGTANILEDIPPTKCKNNPKICLMIKAILGLSILAIILIGFSFA